MIKYHLSTHLLLLVFMLNIAGQTSDLNRSLDAHYAIYLPDTNVAKAPQGIEDFKILDGVVFYNSPIWRPEPDPEAKEKWSEYRDEYAERTSKSVAHRLQDINIQAKHLYLWGCLNSVDISNPLWGGGDGYRNFFIGDTAGTLSISYASGLVDTIPLVFGYTVWWHDNYQAACEPFRSDARSREQLNHALCVVNGLEGYRHDPDDYYLKIVLRNEAVSWIELEDNPERMGYYRVDGLTFGNPGNLEDLSRGNFLLKEGMPLSQQRADSIRDLLVYSADPYPEERYQAILEMRRKYSTFLEDINESTIQQTPPEVLPEDFPGPRVSFSGSPVATLLTRIYYENANQITGRIDPDGMVHESAYKADNYQGFGGWIPELGAFYTDSYTRIRALTVLTHMGFENKVNAAIAFFDKWMMYFPQSFPAVQLGGKPVPGHATVIANKPHIYYNFLRGLGWRTIYESPDFGNPENDGHGLLMITRWRAWLKQGRTKAWVDERWEAINEAAEYIPWCLDNPDLSHSRHGLLHNESEGGMMGQSMYCDYICYLGLLAYAEMADASGRPGKAERWKQQADRLLVAMEAYYPEKIEPWGDVWNPRKNAIFSYIHSTLAPACIGMDFHGFNVMAIMPEDWAERTRNTYQMQLTRNRPAFAAPAGMGYGQCYITQTGLLLDEMDGASLFHPQAGASLPRAGRSCHFRGWIHLETLGGSG
jgi:hypothetical protein